MPYCPCPQTALAWQPTPVSCDSQGVILRCIPRRGESRWRTTGLRAVQECLNLTQSGLHNSQVSQRCRIRTTRTRVSRHDDRTDIPAPLRGSAFARRPHAVGAVGSRISDLRLGPLQTPGDLRPVRKRVDCGRVGSSRLDCNR